MISARRVAWLVLGVAALGMSAPGVRAEDSAPSRIDALCYALASDPLDRDAVAGYAGVAEADINAAALGACMVAVQTDAQNARLHYLLARAELARASYPAALDELKAAADRNYAAAERTLGDLYSTGRGVAADPAVALSHYERANELGDPTGLVATVKLMIAQNAEPGPIVDLLSRAGLAGSSEAWTLLGQLDSTRKDAPHDLVERALINGLARNDDEASLQLAKFYDRQGNSAAMTAIYTQLVAVNNAEAIFELSRQKSGADRTTWLRKAADLGSPAAMYELATDYRDGSGGFAQDLDVAHQWLIKSADAGHPPAMADLGYIGLFDDPVDYPGARKWFEAASAKGDSRAMLGMAYIYEDGDGVPVDLKKALAYYSDAIANGEATYARFERALLEDKPGTLHTTDQAAQDILLASPDGPAAKSADAGLKEFSPETKKAVQVKLEALGQPIGKPDGVFGPASIRALKAYWATL